MGSSSPVKEKDRGGDGASNNEADQPTSPQQHLKGSGGEGSSLQHTPNRRSSHHQLYRAVDRLANAASDTVAGRNTRASYYYTLGLKNYQGSELTMAYGALLDQPIIDVGKLRKLTFKFGVPTDLRPLVWKVLLGIVGSHTEAWEFVQGEIEDRYADLKSAASVITSAESQTISWGESSNEPNGEISVGADLLNRRTRILQMIYQIQKHLLSGTRASFAFHGRPRMPLENELDGAYDLRTISRVFCGVFHVEEDAYYTFSTFMKSKSTDLYQLASDLARLLNSYDPAFSNYLREKNIDIESFARGWFKSYLATAGVSCIERIWDRIVCVSPHFIVYFALAVLLTIKPKLLEKNPDRISQLLTKFPSVNAEVLITKACHFFEQNENDWE